MPETISSVPEHAVQSQADVPSAKVRFISYLKKVICGFLLMELSAVIQSCCIAPMQLISLVFGTVCMVLLVTFSRTIYSIMESQN